jgi:hypothetical protein
MEAALRQGEKVIYLTSTIHFGEEGAPHGVVVLDRDPEGYVVGNALDPQKRLRVLSAKALEATLGFNGMHEAVILGARMGKT